MTPHAVVFLSKGAGALADADAQRAEERLAAALRSSGYDPAVVRLGGGEIENAARRAADEGADVVIVCGGDGSAVDVGEVNGRVFINNASMGAYPRLVELRTQDEAHNGASRLAATVRAG